MCLHCVWSKAFTGPPALGFLSRSPRVRVNCGKECTRDVRGDREGSGNLDGLML